MGTIALEFVPPDAAAGVARAAEETARIAELLRASGLGKRLNALLVPGMIVEDEDRPIPLEEKLDPLDVVGAASPLALEPIVTQVTAFSSQDALAERIRALQSAGVRRTVFVGVPRTLADGEGPGVTPADALAHFQSEMPGRGVIFIPTRDDEKPRFESKVRAGASFALSQMLFTEHVGSIVHSLELEDEARPELLLSFAYVPKLETRIGLIQWLIRDETGAAQREMAWVRGIADEPFAPKKAALVDVYRRIIDATEDAGFEIGVHFECPDGFNAYAFEVFQEMLEYWAPPKD